MTWRFDKWFNWDNQSWRRLLLHLNFNAPAYLAQLFLSESLQQFVYRHDSKNPKRSLSTTVDNNTKLWKQMQSSHFEQFVHWKSSRGYKSGQDHSRRRRPACVVNTISSYRPKKPLRDRFNDNPRITFIAEIFSFRGMVITRLLIPNANGKWSGCCWLDLRLRFLLSQIKYFVSI